MQARSTRGAAVALVLGATFLPRAAAGTGFGNAPPTVDAVSVSPSPAPAGGTATVSCAAHDGDGTVRKLTVSASAGSLPNGTTAQDLAIAPRASASGSIAWSTPGAGSYTVTCTAGDDGGAFGRRGRHGERVRRRDRRGGGRRGRRCAEWPDGAAPRRRDGALGGDGARSFGGALTYAGSALAGSIDGDGASAVFTAPDVGGVAPVTVAVTSAPGASASASRDVSVVLQPYRGGLPALVTGPRRLAASGTSVYVVDGQGALWFLSAWRRSPPRTGRR